MAWAAAWVVALAGAPAGAQVSLSDPRFNDVRRASVVWDNRTGPAREVVDVVCLVPDLPTFLQAVASWDRSHFFPVLIDDVELNLKFLRAFRPSRVVRYPAKAGALPADRVWERAVAAVGRSWAAADAPAAEVPTGDAPPAALGPTPPGVVVSAPGSPALAGAVALAAGRFQPLVRWETARHFGDVVSQDEAAELVLGLEAQVARHVGHYDALGDDCDFVTLAGDYPYRYDLKGQVCAVDDVLLRSARHGQRWGFVGRLPGDAARSAYRAMCSLFLHPESALMLNGYHEKAPPWSDYDMTAAAATLGKFVPVTHRSGPRANLAGWHEAFDPVNRHALIVLNSRGHATDFHLDGGPGQTADVPETGPTAVLMIHSFSAEAPDDPDTIAGRWLENGAFVYFGAMNEPGLQAFRTPGLVASFLADNLPLVVAQRKLAGEVFAEPWRLVYFGDPLYRIRPTRRRGRVTSWAPVDAWPAYGEFVEPPAGAPEALRLNWSLKTAIFGLQTASPPGRKADLAGTLLGIARDRLEPALKPLYDDLLVDTLLEAGRSPALIDRLSRIPPGERSPSVRRHLETAQTVALQRATAAGDFRQALVFWNAVVRARGSRDFVRAFTERVGRLADTPTRRADWAARLRAAVRTAAPENRPVAEAELKRIDDVLNPPRRGR